MASVPAIRGTFKNYADLWKAFARPAENLMRHVFIQQYVADRMKAQFMASPMNSMLHDLCMKSCTDMHTGPIEGALYLGFFDTIGFATAMRASLAAIKKLVFDDKKLSMSDLLEALEDNFESNEVIRQMCLKAPKYGNNDPYADSIGHDLEAFFAALAHRHKTAFGGELDVRYVTITSHIPFGTILGPPRMEENPVKRCRTVLPRPEVRTSRVPPPAWPLWPPLRCGAYKERAARLLNIKLSPASVAGQTGTRKLMSLIRTAL